MTATSTPHWLVPGEKFCLCCQKLGHFTNECHSTHGLNEPAAREIGRLCLIANARAALPVQVAPKPAAVIARGASPADTLETLVEQYIEHGDLPAYMLDAAMEVVKNARSALARPAAATSLEPADERAALREAIDGLLQAWYCGRLKALDDESSGYVNAAIEQAEAALTSPALPAPVGGPQLSTDERAAFEAWHENATIDVSRTQPLKDCARAGWKARAELASRSPAVEPADDACICKGNWRAIVKEIEHLIDRRFTSDDGKVFTFFGLVHGQDDYYYGMWNRDNLRLLTCVGSIEGHGYTLVPSAADRVAGAAESNEQSGLEG